MASRARDWFNQAAKDLEQAKDCRQAGRHEWACFASQQAAERAVKALHLHLGQEAWGHVIAKLMQELPQSISVAEELINKARVLDNFYIPARYPNSHPEGAPLNIMGRSKAARQSTMPVRSLSSSVLKWPDLEAIKVALQDWVRRAVACHSGVVRIGYFGSYARGDWSVGSDLDLVIVVESSNQPFERRSVDWHTTDLPVPVDALVYTQDEWKTLGEQGRFQRTLARQIIWLYEREGARPLH